MVTEAATRATWSAPISRMAPRAEDEEKDPNGTKDPGLDHGHRVQQRAHGSGRHHRRRQPAMHRHERVLCESEKKEGENHEKQCRLLGQLVNGQDAAGAKLQGPGEVVGQDNGRQQEHLWRHPVDR